VLLLDGVFTFVFDFDFVFDSDVGFGLWVVFEDVISLSGLALFWFAHAMPLYCVPFVVFDDDGGGPGGGGMFEIVLGDGFVGGGGGGTNDEFDAFVVVETIGDLGDILYFG